jgi:hypothetical protein
MTKVALLIVLAFGIGVGHAFCLWRLVRRLHADGKSRRELLFGALGLRLLPASALVAAIWSGSVETALAAFAALWVGRTVVLLGVRGARD